MSDRIAGAGLALVVCCIAWFMLLAAIYTTITLVRWLAGIVA